MTQANKPNFVFGMAIPLIPMLPWGFSDLPETYNKPGQFVLPRDPEDSSLCDLAPRGVCHVVILTYNPVVSYTTFSPLPSTNFKIIHI